MKYQSSAPGKLILTGEYAVLKGAPAIVLAMNRRANVSIEYVASPQCSFKSTGLEASTQHTLSHFLTDDAPENSDPAYLVWHVIQALSKSHSLLKELTGFKLHTDSSALFWQGEKLGLGSSAAICTSLTASFLALYGSSEQPDIETIFDNALSAHRAAQGSRGSGVDVAAATYGGVISYIRSSSETRITDIKLPSNMHYQVFSSGQPANTTHYLKKFNAWLDKSNNKAFEFLCDAAREVTSALSNQSAAWYITMSKYTQALQEFDAASQLGIYTPAYRSMNVLALEHRILYKPCGAGGGDLGIAMSDNPEALKAFVAAAKQTTDTSSTFLEINLEIDTNGVQTG